LAWRDIANEPGKVILNMGLLLRIGFQHLEKRF
jgi:hypothetical protein